MPSDSLHCIVLTDGRRGIENQALGLTDALQRLRPLETLNYTLNSGSLFKAAPPLMQLSMRRDPSDYGLPVKAPDMAIGCGRQAIAPLLAIKERSPSCFTAYIQNPRISTDRFDLVIAPEHDDVSGNNVVSMIGSPNRINNDDIIGRTLEFANRLNDLPMPRAAFLIGGDSKSHKLSKAVLSRHVMAMEELIEKGYSLLVTISRRTPAFAVQAYQQLAARFDNIWLYQDDGPNPYLAFLGGADIILVTEDSTNMLTEATRTGKPVFTLPMQGGPGKFARLYERLSEKCGVTPYHSDVTAAHYEPLDETARVAELFWGRFDRFQAIAD